MSLIARSPLVHLLLAGIVAPVLAQSNSSADALRDIAPNATVSAPFGNSAPDQNLILRTSQSPHAPSLESLT